MPKLFEITIPGVSMKADYPAVRHRLLADFPHVLEVLATTTPATVQIAFRGQEELNAWLDALSDSVATSGWRSAAAISAAPPTPPAPHDRFGNAVIASANSVPPISHSRLQPKVAGIRDLVARAPQAVRSPHPVAHSSSRTQRPVAGLIAYVL